MSTDNLLVVPPHAVPYRDRLAIALDTDDIVAALRLADDLAPFFRVAKVGLELYSAEGPDAVAALAERGWDVFVDLKLHDIPTTVGRAARVLGGLGARFVTMHAAGGTDMLRAGNDALVEGARNAGLAIPMALGVTILTSEGSAPRPLLRQRIEHVIAAGCGGVVCAASDVEDVKDILPDLFTAVPGIRPAGANRNEQARAATPTEALNAGADLLVVGRAVTAAKDPIIATEALLRELAGAES
jgi:orotidine-5'-phosphate decarboxylase